MDLLDKIALLKKFLRSFSTSRNFVLFGKTPEEQQATFLPFDFIPISQLPRSLGDVQTDAAKCLRWLTELFLQEINGRNQQESFHIFNKRL